LQELLELMDQHKRDAAEFEKFDQQFHLAIAKASRNVLGPNLVKWLWNLREAEMFFSWFSKTRSESYRQRTVRDHEKNHERHFDAYAGCSDDSHAASYRCHP